MDTLKGDWEVEVEVSGASMLAARVAISPLMTLVGALLDTLGDRPDSPWRRILRERARGLDPGPLAVFGQRGGVLPDNLLPLPPRPGITFQEQISALRAQPESLIAHDLATRFDGPLPPELLPFAASPGAETSRFCDALVVYWEKLLAPSWPRMQRLLEREVLLLGHTLATDGLVPTLAGLHPELAYADGRLRFHSNAVFQRSYVADKPLLLIPLACEQQRILANEGHPDATVIAYGARGSAELWGEGIREPGAELAALLGGTRATIALALALPATTTDIAEQLELSPSTVSRHLSELVATGLADRARRGPAVYYRLTVRGNALLDLF